MVEPPLRVLVPRPARDNDPVRLLLAELDLQGRAVKALMWPVMAIQSLLVEHQKQQFFLRQLESSDIVIFVSAPAVEIVCQAVGVAPLAEHRILSVGRSTAQYLCKVGLTADYPEDATTEGLLAMPVLQKVAHNRILICRGKEGRETLADSLLARGATVEYAELYNRVPDSSCRNKICSALADNAINAVFIHSGSVFHHLLALLDGPAKAQVIRLPMIVPGERVAGIVRQGGAENVTVAKNALPENMVAGLVHWYTQDKQITG